MNGINFKNLRFSRAPKKGTGDMTVQSSLPDQGDLIRAGAMLSRAQNFKSLSAALLERLDSLKME
jgi:hypothetical protein